MSDKTDNLAINGGNPVTSEPFPMWPQFSDKVFDHVLEPLKTGLVNYWTGTKGMEFEEKFARYNGVKYAVTTTNGTAALHTALNGFGVGPGDEVIVTSYSFIASSMCVVQAGAIPVFADVRKEDHTIDPFDIEAKITERTVGIIPVHLYGIIVDLDPILEIAKKHGLFVLEDVAQAPGGEYKGKKAGTVGNAGAFSFCQSKHFTTAGEGGAVITDDEEVAWICRSFRDHGYDVKERLRLLELEQKLPYIHERIGFNYRMTEIQSIIGIYELERLDSYHLKRRRENGEYLLEKLSGHPLIQYLPPHSENRKNAFWWFPIVVDLESIRVGLRELVEALKAEGIPVMPVQWPQAYKEKAYSEHRGFGKYNFPFESKEYTNPKSVDYKNWVCPNAKWLEERTLAFPVHPVYELKHMDYFIEALNKVYEAYKS